MWFVFPQQCNAFETTEILCKTLWHRFPLWWIIINRVNMNEYKYNKHILWKLLIRNTLFVSDTHVMPYKLYSLWAALNAKAEARKITAQGIVEDILANLKIKNYKRVPSSLMFMDRNPEKWKETHLVWASVWLLLKLWVRLLFKGSDRPPGFLLIGWSSLIKSVMTSWAGGRICWSGHRDSHKQLEAHQHTSVPDRQLTSCREQWL